MTRTDSSASRTIRPLRHLQWYRTSVGTIAIVAPAAAVGIALAIQNGRHVPALGVGAAMILTIAVALVPVLVVRLDLSRDGARFVHRPGLAHPSIARAEVGSAIIRPIYNADGVTSTDHLFLVDKAGGTLLRMNSRWWSREQLLAVARHFDVSLEAQAQPVQLAELRRTVPGQLTWAERHRLVGGVIVCAGGFLLCLAFAAVVTAGTR